MINAKTFIAGAAALLLASAASAAPLVTNGSVARAAYPSSGLITFDGGAGAAELTFTLTGFNSVDGMNAISGGTDFSDLFSFSLNGANVLSGYFVLGGIGSDNIVSQQAGTSFFKTGGNTLGARGTVNFSSALNLLAGANTLTFAYATPNAQPFNDESFAISNVVVNGNMPVASAVPEPATWAMMIFGFGMVGAGLRSRRTKTWVRVSDA